MKSLLVIMTKQPMPGQVKTRLCPPLSVENAATLYDCFFQDRLTEMSRITDRNKAIAYMPETAKEYFKRYESQGYHIFPQKGNDLGDRMYYIFEDKLKAGYDVVVIIGSDTPDLPSSIVQNAFQLLSAGETDLILGPAKDGGYYLIGMKKPCPDMFQNIPWGIDTVFSKTLDKAEALDIRTKVIQIWSDIDTFEDLLRFYDKYKKRSDNRPYPGQKTMTFLKKELHIENII